MQGLTAPLLAAGGRAIVATGWRVADGPTVTFVEGMYNALAEGRPVVDALRAVKVELLRRGSPIGEWASFSVVGDPLVTVALRAPPRRWRSWRLLVPVALLVGLGLAGTVGWWRRRTDRGV
jgi:hypothetical protein